jgi:hypothetical protein
MSYVVSSFKIIFLYDISYKTFSNNHCWYLQSVSILLCVFTAHRLHNFQVGLSHSSPSAVAPAVTNYHVCGTHRPEVRPSAWVTIDCHRKAGRFVIVQICGKKEILTLCEVEVHGKRKTFIFCDIETWSEMLHGLSATHHVECWFPFSPLIALCCKCLGVFIWCVPMSYDHPTLPHRFPHLSTFPWF